jgi:apolipoprotein N-acyltransferase
MVAQNYDYYSNTGWLFLWISSIILLVLANVVLWTTRNAWAMWATFLYFALFMLIRTLWLDQSFFDYQRQNGITNRAFFLGAFSGILFCVLAAVIVFFNQFIVKRMRDKMFQPQLETEGQTQAEIGLNKNT